MFKKKQFTSKSGKEYVFQQPGVRALAKINDSSKNKFGVLQEEKLAEAMLSKVIVEPKMRIDDFESYAEYHEVVNAAYAFAIGKEDDGDADQQEDSEREG